MCFWRILSEMTSQTCTVIKIDQGRQDPSLKEGYSITGLRDNIIYKIIVDFSNFNACHKQLTEMTNIWEIFI